MATPEELDELFAYLDQLELNERIEQEKAAAAGLQSRVPGSGDNLDFAVGIESSKRALADNGDLSDGGLQVIPALDELDSTSLLSPGGK